MATIEQSSSGSKEKRIEFKRLGYRLELVISADALECAAVYEPSTTNGTPLTLQELKTYLAQAKIIEGLIDNAINDLISAAAALKPLTGFVIARGTPMVPGDDGRIELAVTDSLDTSAEGDEETEECKLDTVDLKRVQSFFNVSAGQLIGTILRPGSGSMGKNVHGAPIYAKAGKLFQPNILKNIRLAEDRTSLYAEADGRFFARESDISVEDVYTIKGDVDFKIGMIVFNGFVDIRGDILDGFTVKATKGIKVQGNIGVCEVSSEGDISFCGMNGQGKGSITCGGQIRANFIYETNIISEGDILIDTEIRNCNIKTHGAIRINKGVLAGGEYIAMGGIESNVIGTITSLRTRVIVGVSYKCLEELNLLFNELKTLIAKFAEKNFPVSGERIPADPKAFAAARADITSRIQEVRSREFPSCNPKINVKKHLYDGVNITISSLSEDVRDDRKGPFSIIENTLEGGFRYLGLTDLRIKAKDIEAVFVQQNNLMQRNNQGGE